MPSEAAPIYRKFSPRQRSFLFTGQLWAGADHLLVVSTVFAVENYRRFYFHDIEALIIRPTKARQNWLIVHIIGLLLFGLGAAGLEFAARRGHANHDLEEGMAILCAVCAAAFLIGLISQLIKGPTCLVYLQMRTGLEKLSFYKRLRPALKMRERLTALIAERAPATP